MAGLNDWMKLLYVDAPWGYGFFWCECLLNVLPDLLSPFLAILDKTILTTRFGNSFSRYTKLLQLKRSKNEQIS